MNRAILFPPATVSHLASEGLHGELADLLALERSGMALGLVALPSAVEDSLYRFNNLPARLAALYAGLDPFDPDEDLLEEAEEGAMWLVDQAHLLDEVIDAVYEALASLPAQLVVRRPGDPKGLEVADRRGALLALKRLARIDWSARSVMTRLEATASVALDARVVIVHAAGSAHDAALSARAAEVLGRPVDVAGWEGAVTRVT